MRHARCLARVEKEFQIYRETNVQRLFDDIRKDISTNRRWRPAADQGASNWSTSSPPTASPSTCAGQMSTLQNNAEIEERQELEIRIQEYLCATGKFEAAIELGEDLMRPLPPFAAGRFARNAPAQDSRAWRGKASRKSPASVPRSIPSAPPANRSTSLDNIALGNDPRLSPNDHKLPILMTNSQAWTFDHSLVIRVSHWSFSSLPFCQSYVNEKILTDLCSVPTAPFAEHFVIDFVRRFVKNRPKLKLSQDRFKNLLIELPARGSSKSPRLVFVAHMDHPGFVARRMIDSRTLLANFYGGVLDDYVQKQKVIFFDSNREIPGVVIATTKDKEHPNYPATATIRVNGACPKPARRACSIKAYGRIKGGKFYARACDDPRRDAPLAATKRCSMNLLKHPPRTSVAVLLTRAEEDAFIGAIASVLYPTLLNKTDRVISIETSAMQPYARQGDGVVLRVGDRTSVFNSAFMYFLHQQAQELAKEAKKFKYQRSLMPGGTCEATVFDAYGYVTGAACVPLGNYHNMDRQRKNIGPEYVDVKDWNNMVKLFVRVAQHAHEFSSDLGPLKKRIEKHFRKRRHF